MKIEFSKNGEGKILMTAVGNTLYLSEPKNINLKLGDKLTLNPETDKTILAELNFYKIESIDILIEKLIAIRNNIMLNNAS